VEVRQIIDPGSVAGVYYQQPSATVCEFGVTQASAFDDADLGSSILPRFEDFISFKWYNDPLEFPPSEAELAEQAKQELESHLKFQNWDSKETRRLPASYSLRESVVPTLIDLLRLNMGKFEVSSHDEKWLELNKFAPLGHFHNGWALDPLTGKLEAPPCPFVVPQVVDDKDAFNASLMDKFLEGGMPTSAKKPKVKLIAPGIKCERRERHYHSWFTTTKKTRVVTLRYRPRIVSRDQAEVDRLLQEGWTSVFSKSDTEGGKREVWLSAAEATPVARVNILEPNRDTVKLALDAPPLGLEDVREYVHSGEPFLLDLLRSSEERLEEAQEASGSGRIVRFTQASEADKLKRKIADIQEQLKDINSIKHILDDWWDAWQKEITSDEGNKIHPLKWPVTRSGKPKITLVLRAPEGRTHLPEADIKILQNLHARIGLESVCEMAPDDAVDESGVPRPLPQEVVKRLLADSGRKRKEAGYRPLASARDRAWRDLIVYHNALVATKKIGKALIEIPKALIPYDSTIQSYGGKSKVQASFEKTSALEKELAALKERGKAAEKATVEALSAQSQVMTNLLTELNQMKEAVNRAAVTGRNDIFEEKMNELFERLTSAKEEIPKPKEEAFFQKAQDIVDTMYSDFTPGPDAAEIKPPPPDFTIEESEPESEERGSRPSTPSTDGRTEDVPLSFERNGKVWTLLQETALYPGDAYLVAVHPISGYPYVYPVKVALPTGQEKETNGLLNLAQAEKSQGPPPVNKATKPKAPSSAPTEKPGSPEVLTSWLCPTCKKSRVSGHEQGCALLKVRWGPLDKAGKEERDSLLTNAPKKRPTTLPKVVPKKEQPKPKPEKGKGKEEQKDSSDSDAEEIVSPEVKQSQSETDPLRAVKDRLSPDAEKKLRRHFSVEDRPSDDELSKLTPEQRRVRLERCTIPKWAVAAVKAHADNLPDICSGKLTKETFAAGLYKRAGKRLSVKEVSAKWIALKNRYTGTDLLEKPNTRKERAFKAEFDALVVLAGDNHPALPKPRRKSGQEGNSSRNTSGRQSRQSNRDQTDDLSRLVKLAEALGGIAKAFK